VKAFTRARANKVENYRPCRAKAGRLAELADHCLIINSEHYGKVEDAHMGICHMLCYAFIENPEIGKAP
jgi:D-sedoheptulose 7-phosphate isomerase